MDFFELLKFSIGSIKKVSSSPSEEEWETMHAMAHKQALTGLLYDGITKLPEDRRPPKKLLLKWYAESEVIRKKNEKVNAVAVEVTEMFEQVGIENCILKGQGNATMYGNPFIRIPGDIDIWINPSKAIVDHGALLVGERRLPVKKISYRHIEIGLFHDVEVEIHLRPSFMNNLIHNHRLQKWFDVQAKQQFCHTIELPNGVGKMNMPTIDFNLVYQLCHITNHFFYEGIGLRQFVDYYYLLKEVEHVDKEQFKRLLEEFGLWQMAGAVMYVERELLGLDDRYLMVPVDKKRGRFLVREIILSGNFGKFDSRVSSKHRKTSIGRNVERLRRDFRMMRLFPSESLWEPVFRLYHYCWRKRHS